MKQKLIRSLRKEEIKFGLNLREIASLVMIADLYPNSCL